MTSTADDLARWGDALYAGSIVEPATRDAMLEFNGHDHGLGVQRLDLGAIEGYGHTGLLDRFTSMMLHLPREDVTIALLVNRAKVDLAAALAARPDDGPSLIGLVREGS